MKGILIIFIALILFLPPSAFAQPKEIIAEGTYNMGDGETPSVAESRALLNAKRIALEQAGTYVESYSKVKNMRLTEDEVKVLTSGLMEVIVLDKKRTVVGDGIHFWVKIKAKVNPDNMEEMAKKVKDKSVVEDYKKIQEAYDKSQKEIEELKKQLAKAKGEKEKKQLEAKITDEERLFQAFEWFEKGLKYDIYKAYDKAIEAYTNVIVLNPNHALAYFNRGRIFLDYKSQYDRSIEDFNRAIIIGDAISKSPFIYYARGMAYFRKGQYDMAIKDCNRAIDIAWNYADAYYCLGNVYVGKKQYDKAIENFSMAIKGVTLSERQYQFYYNRGTTYLISGQYDKAIDDFNETISLNSNLAEAYTNRGIAYYQLGNLNGAIPDLQKGCDMGNVNGCEALQMVLKKRNK
jgi:tetratricopeptide (TPR) repeat protein